MHYFAVLFFSPYFNIDYTIFFILYYHCSFLFFLCLFYFFSFFFFFCINRVFPFNLILTQHQFNYFLSKLSNIIMYLRTSHNSHSMSAVQLEEGLIEDAESQIELLSVMQSAEELSPEFLYLR